MKKIFITLFTVFLAYIISYYTTDAHKKHELFDFGNSNLLYKISALISGETDTTDAFSVYERGLRYLDYQEFDAAINDFDKALYLDSNFIFDEYVYESYFTIYLEAHDTTKAIAFLEYFLKKETYNTEAINKLAEIYMWLGDSKTSKAYLKKSIRVEPNYNNDAFFKLATTFLTS